MKIRESDLRKIIREEILESAKQDKQFRERAKKAVRSAVKYVQSGGEIRFREGKYHYIKLSNEDLEIRFGLQSDEGSAYYGEDGKQKYIRLNGILYSLKFGSQEALRDEIINVLERKKNDFIHEYIHYLDDKRSEHDFFGRSAEFGSEEYYREDEEVNAYFQQAMASAEEKINRKNWRGFRELKNWFFGNAIEDEVVKNITTDQRKRLVKRLYDYWTNYIQ